VFVLIYAIPNCGVVWTGEKIFLLILMIVCGMFVFSGLFVIGAGFCFFTTQGLEVLNIFTDGGKQFGQYPFSIYGEGILRFFTYVIPLALFQYYPFLYLVGESDNRLYMLFPLLSLLFLIPCFLFWRFGMRHYKSTGS
jgi:ABC-2 type transport system permease protein